LNLTVIDTQDISGVVFEDIVGDVLADGAVGSPLNPGANNVTVRLSLDDGNGVPDGADGVVATTSTDPAGAYSFTGLAPGTYFVAVDSQTVDGSTGYHPLGVPQNVVWAEQT
jgi:hypothetical protein